MLKSVLKAVMGTRHDREVRKIRPLVDQINAEWEQLQGLSEDELRGKTDQFRALLGERTADLEAQLAELRAERRQAQSAGDRQVLADEIGAVERELRGVIEGVLDEILPEAFAVVKEGCRRLVGTRVAVTGQELTWDMVPYDVQLIGGITLHQGKVAEMATGEGKTLVATMPLYLNALAGRGAHLVTVNSYLAQRDSEWMGHLYRYLGLSVDCIDLHEPGTPERRDAYAADITYGTNNEFGFDYLRDNMVLSLEQRVQRGHHFAIIDEVDSVLIDEARTPLIISGPVGSETNETYARYNPAVAELFRRQNRMIGDMIAQAERDHAESREYEAGEKLLAARRGMPRNKRLMKLFADTPALQKLVLKVEGDYMRDKRLHDVDDRLLFSMDEKGHQVQLSDQGLEVLDPHDPEAFIVPDLSEATHQVEHDPELNLEQKRAAKVELEREYAEKSEKIHVIHQLLKAYSLYSKDEQYVIQDGQVLIVDEFTGRMMPGRRWSDGLHQAVEAKEMVQVKGETQTLATVTIQNYFRLYPKLAGMTGTAETEEAEFQQIYKLDVQVIPTNRPTSRDDREDYVFRTKREKYNAIIEEIERLHALEFPVLVGTVSVDVSETLSRLLKRRGIQHEVLNAKQHAREAQIVAMAGQPGAVTIATNMAGRGTDIKLGAGVTEAKPSSVKDPDGNEVEVEEIGGLHIIGSERHESRRIDRQLRGRAGRQGDPGASQFFLSLEDDLMRLFGSDRVAGVMDRLGAQEGEVITNKWLTRAIEGAQRRVELQNFEARKRLLEYDDVMNQQREVIYDLRTFALEGGEELSGEVWDMVERALDQLLDEHAPLGDAPDDWALADLRSRLLLDFFLPAEELPQEGEDNSFDNRAELRGYLMDRARDQMDAKLRQFGPAADDLLRFLVLQTIDDKWRDHLYDLDHLKASIGFRGWGQKDPLVEYKKEAYDMFVDLMRDIHAWVARLVFRAQLEPVAPRQSMPPSAPLTLTLSGFGPEDQFGSTIAQVTSDAEEPQPPTAPPAAGPLLGVNPMAAVGPIGGPIGGRPFGLDVADLDTNRGEDDTRRKPAAATAVIGRNDPCPCGSGKKYKKCHGA